MDIFQWWENWKNPIVKANGDLAAEALRKYQAGEIDFATYQAAAGKAQELEQGIADAQADYEKAVEQEYSLDLGNIVAPVTDQVKNLFALLLVAGAIYLVIRWKSLET